MSDEPTPRTEDADDLAGAIGGFIDDLKRQRDEARELAQELRDALQMANEWSKLYVGHEGTYAKILTKAKEVLP